jgi:hypothetical protein
MIVNGNPRAVLRAMSLYRAAYPEGDLVLICDNGCFNFSAAARFYGAHWEERAHRLVVKAHVGFFLQLRETLQLFRALAYATGLIGSSHFLYLETDTHVFSRLPPGPRYTLSGITPIRAGWFVGGEPKFGEHYNPFFRPEKWPRSPNPKVFGFQIPYGGQGGSLFHTGFIRGIVTQPEEHLQADLALFGSCSTTSGVDYVLSAMVYRYNGTIGPLAGAVNWPYPEHYSEQQMAEAAVLHPDKSDYDQPVSDEDALILGPHWESTLQAAAPPADDPFNHMWDMVLSSPVCGKVEGLLGGYVPRPGSEGLAQDARERNERWDLREIQGPGYYIVNGTFEGNFFRRRRLRH